MKIRAIASNNLNIYKQENSRIKRENTSLRKNIEDDDILTNMPCYYPISFSGIQNSSKLRMLFSYGIPCMYTMIETIDPKVLNRWIKNNLFLRPMKEVMPILEPFWDTLTAQKVKHIPNLPFEVETKVWEIIKERAAIHPEKNIREILQEIKPVYQRRLRKRQTPIFHELTEAAHELPDKYRYKFKLLMEDTEKKLNERPVIIPFSSYEFKYKLSKIKDDVGSVKSKKVMNKLIKESRRLSNTTSAKTLEHQKNVINFMDIILKKSVLKENQPLRNLIDTSKSRLNQDEIIVPFTRKSFIYDLAKIIEDLPNKKLQDELLNIATKLPTSQESKSAFILKVVNEPPEKIGHRLVWPFTATVEHIHPRSCGGPDIMSNYGTACAVANSKRKSDPFTQQMKQCPTTSIASQAQADYLIKLYHDGVFAKFNINPKYIEDYRKAILVESKGRLNIDTSKLYQKPTSD